MPGKHAAPEAFGTVISDYVTDRARELVAQADTPGSLVGHLDAAEWIGSATEILRELTRDA
jgi:hypothetical protein